MTKTNAFKSDKSLFDSDQKWEICMGLILGLDVARYAKPDLTYKQMREIRKELEKKRDEKMNFTPAKKAKSLGCKSLAVVSQETGIPRQKLERWHSMYPETFKKLCLLVAKV